MYTHICVYIYTVYFFYSVLFEMTFISRPEGNFVYLIRHFTHYEWPFEIFIEIFGLLKINKSTGSDKDEEVQRRTARVYSENLRNTKLCHSSSTRVHASLWNQGQKKKVAVHSKRLWESQSPLWYNRISSRNPQENVRERKEPAKLNLEYVNWGKLTLVEVNNTAHLQVDVNWWRR